MKKLLTTLLIAIILSACTFPSPSNLFGPSQEKAYWEEVEAQSKVHEMKMRMSLPNSFYINSRDYYNQVDYDDSCRITPAYLAETNDPAYVGMEFTSQLVETTVVSDTEVKSRFLLVLQSVNIENHIVNLEKQTVEFADGSESTQVLDPKVWLDRANEISKTVTDTRITVIYTVNPNFRTDIDFVNAEQHERFYWIAISATCTVGQ